MAGSLKTQLRINTKVGAKVTATGKYTEIIVVGTRCNYHARAEVVRNGSFWARSW